VLDLFVWAKLPSGILQQKVYKPYCIKTIYHPGTILVMVKVIFGCIVKEEKIQEAIDRFLL
jgi:hypothetical protein